MDKLAGSRLHCWLHHCTLLRLLHCAHGCASPPLHSCACPPLHPCASPPLQPCACPAFREHCLRKGNFMLLKVLSSHDDEQKVSKKSFRLTVPPLCLHCSTQCTVHWPISEHCLGTGTFPLLSPSVKPCPRKSINGLFGLPCLCQGAQMPALVIY